MTRIVVGLAGLFISYVWAQSAGVWHWHHHSSSGTASPTEGWIGAGGLLFRSIPGKVVVVGDTVYVLGSLGQMGVTEFLALPNSSVQLSANSNGNSAYIAAYRRDNGGFLWAMHFYGQNGGGTIVRGVELLVDNDGTVYTILHAWKSGASDNLTATFYHGSGSASLTLSPSNIPDYPASFIVRFRVSGIAVTGLAVQRLGCAQTGVGAPPCDATNFEANFFSLLLHEGKLWASGTVKTSRQTPPLTGSNYLAPSNVSSAIMPVWDGLFTQLLTGGTASHAVLLRMEGGPLLIDSASVVQSAVAIGTSHPACYGRALFAYGPDTVGWVVALRESGDKRYRVVGGASTVVPGTPALRVILVRASTMALASSPPSALANYANASSNSAPPHYYVAFRRQGNSGGEIFWAAADTAYYFIQSQHYAETFFPRLLISRAILNASGIFTRTTLESQPLSQLQLSGIAIEPSVTFFGQPVPYIYLGGSLQGGSLSLYQGPVSSGTLLTTQAGSPSSNPNNFTGFILGLQWHSGGWQYRGYKRIFSLATGPSTVTCMGMGRHPTLPQLYTYGASGDSLLVEPRWADGRADTVRPSSGSNPLRLWVGRLDLYRLEDMGAGVFVSTCAPESLSNSPPIRFCGTWSPLTDRAFVWLPEDPTRRYQGNHSWAAITANLLGAPASFQEGCVSGSFSSLLPGRMPPGRYFLALRSPVLGGRFADIGDTTWITIPGTSVPNLQRTGALRWHRIVLPFTGNSDPFADAASGSASFYRLERNFFDPRSFAYIPWDGGASGIEWLYILEIRSSDSYLYRLNLLNGMVQRLRSWSSSPTDVTHRGTRLIADPVRSALWTHTGRILWRIDTADATRDDSLILHTASATYDPSAVFNVGYPLRTSQLWINNVSFFTCTENGDLVGFVQHRTSTGNRWVLVRIAPERDSTLIVAGGTPFGCPLQEGTGTQVSFSGDFSELTSDGDTLYWIERPNCTNAWRLLRKAWPVDQTRRIYEVRTIDTLDRTFSTNYHAPLFSRVPDRGLYMAGTQTGNNNFLLWYDLNRRTRDTLLGCLSPSNCCTYDLNDMVSLPTIPVPYIVLRGGTILYALPGFSSNLFAVLPLRLRGQGDTLRAEANLIAATGGSIYQDTLLLNGSTPDSTRLSATVCGGIDTYGKSFWYGALIIDTPAIRLIAPDTVCNGMRFSVYVAWEGLPDTQGCPVGRGLIDQLQGRQGKVYPSLIYGLIFSRWRAWDTGEDTIALSLTRSRWTWLTGSPPAHPIKVRTGHRLRMRVALEGTWRKTATNGALMRAHPFLSHLVIALYNERTNGVSPDSLWRLPYPRGDSLAQVWDYFFLAPSPLGCPSSGASWCETPFTQICRVDVHDAVTGQLVDSTYALIDTMGWLIFYRAPLQDAAISDEADILHFCHCDPAPAKYFIIRSPNHLPLYTQAINLPARSAAQDPDSLDLTDPSSLQGIPGIHYTLLADSTVSPPRMRAGAWAGNCADLHNSFVPGPHHDSGVVNAADWEFFMPRNGITTGYSWADLDGDGAVTAADEVILITNQNALRQSAGP